MRVSRRWLCLVVLAVQLWQASALSMTALCSVWHGTGYIGDSSDCWGWGYCKSNKLVAQGRCSEDFYYNAKEGRCVDTNQLYCAPKYWELCLHRKPAEYVAAAMDCRKYYKCDYEDDDERVNYCAEGYGFSNRLQSCVPIDRECPEDNLNICAYVQDDITLGNPLSCGLYIECRNGKARLGVCTAGRYYNYKTGQCQATRPEHCGKDSYQPVNEPPPATDASICADFYQDDHSGDQYFTDAQTCYGYYTCSSKHAAGKWHNCPQGKHFHWWKQKCVRPESYSCPFDRCGNHNLSFVATINSGCSEYIRCEGQTSHKLFKCPEEYPYFDERQGICVNGFTNYAVCFMND